MKSRDVHTCYGCVQYYSDFGIFMSKHCDKDHIECPHYWGEDWNQIKELRDEPNDED